MSAGSRQVAVAAAEPGARLARDVCDGAGRVLIAAGTELTPASLAALRQRGIPRLEIEEPLSAAELEARREAVARRLVHLFRRETDNPLMMRLHDAVLAYRLERLR